MVGQGRNFQNGGTHMAEKRYSEIDFCKYSISKENDVTNIPRRIYIKRARHPFVSSLLWAHHGWAR